ncbi:toll/interleukin-1 receptor domain-containing protein [Sphingobacterium thalpophilum]|uniref:toll/interleukin-1 receptor domain-containing protein n=1 Tax=Sphingobacterium thalpophilum TaxID=259 RepID=UPI003D96286C
MEYKYQLILLGTNVPEKETVLSKVFEKLKDLGLPNTIIKVIEASNVETEYLGNQPAFGIYFGSVDGDHQHLDITNRLLKDGTMILPIYYGNPEGGAFSREIPRILSNQNGILFNDNEIDRITNIILESFELLRSTRKVFISYKRSESTSVAIQLFEALEAYNYDVFLDTHSIGKGEPFQDELWHRMTDCDVIILLSTPKFLESHWCKEEFAEAGSKRIGIVQIIWPNHEMKDIDSSSLLSYPVKLSDFDFLDNSFNDKDRSKLVSGVIEKIIQKVESVRARNLASRQDNLITEFRNIAHQCGREVTVQPEKFLTEILATGKRIIYIPTIGVPQSASCQSAEIRHEFDKGDVEAIRLIYDDLRIRDRWLKHLDWLNNNFRKNIQTLKKQEFRVWLERTK